MSILRRIDELQEVAYKYANSDSESHRRIRRYLADRKGYFFKWLMGEPN